MMDDPDLKKLERDRNLSPNAKLRILKRKLEFQNTSSSFKGKEKGKSVKSVSGLSHYGA